MCKLWFSLIDLFAHIGRINSTIAQLIGLFVLLLLPNNIFCLPFAYFFFPFNYIFYLIGIVLMNKRLPNIPTFYFVIGCILTIIVGYFYPTKWTFYRVNMCIYDNSMPYKPLFLLLRWSVYIIATLSAFETLRRLFKCFSNNYYVRILTNLGNKTLLIYGFHIIIVADIFGYFVREYCGVSGCLSSLPLIRYYLLSTFLSVITILLCILLDNLIHKNRILTLFFLGERFVK